MSHSNGIIMADANGGINIRGDIAYVLGRNTGDIGLLCSDKDVQGNDVNAIQKWSLYKPVRHHNLGELTEAELKSVCYGYDVHDYTLLSAAVTAWQNGTIWDYLKPRGKGGGGSGANEWYRAMDFNGYNSAAICPFQVTFDSQPTIGNSAQYNCSFVTDIVDWGPWADFGPTYANLYLVLVKTGGTQGTQIYPISSSQTDTFISIVAGSDKMNYRVDSGAFTAGSSYVIFPCLTTYDAGVSYNTWININETGGSVGHWWPMPAPSTSIVPRTQASPSDLTYVSLVDFDFVSYDQANFTSTVKNIDYSIRNANAASLTSVTVRPYVYNANNVKTYLASATSVGTVASGETKTGTLVPSNYTYTNNTPLQAQVFIEVVATYNGSTYTKVQSLLKNAEKE